MPIPLFGLQAQYSHIRHEINAAVQRVLEHCQFILGDEVDKFEREFAEYVRAKGAVGVARGRPRFGSRCKRVGFRPGTRSSRPPIRSSRRLKPFSSWAPSPSLWISILGPIR